MRNRNSFFPTLRVHLGHVLDGGGDAEVVALGVLELAADALDLVLAGAGPQRGGERAERAQACREKTTPPKSRETQSAVNPTPAAAFRRTARVQQPREDRSAVAESAGDRRRP